MNGAGVVRAPGNVLRDRALEKNGFLANKSHLRPKPLQLIVADVNAVDLNRSRSRIVEALKLKKTKQCFPVGLTILVFPKHGFLTLLYKIGAIFEAIFRFGKKWAGSKCVGLL